jgi:hypothetical protein
MKVISFLFGILAGFAGLGWLGLRLKSRPFPPFSQQMARLDTTALPDGLPAPVERFYRRLYGESVPLIESAVITGRGTMRINGLTFPVRFRITHLAGQGYHHYFELTFFGLPLLKVNETYLDGKCRLELPFGVVEGEKVNQGANLALWAESIIWLPALLITNPGVQWMPVDEVTVLLSVPFGAMKETFVVRFDPESGRPRLVESMRYKGQDSEAKTLWLNEAITWAPLNGYTLCAAAALTWLDEGTSWAIFNTEEVVYDVPVQEQFQTDLRNTPS